jgi:hypothetical protein
MQQKMMDEMQARMKAAFDANDPEGMVRAWLPFLRDGRRGEHVPEIPEGDVGQRHRHAQKGRQIALSS